MVPAVRVAAHSVVRRTWPTRMAVSHVWPAATLSVTNIHYYIYRCAGPLGLAHFFCTAFVSFISISKKIIFYGKSSYKILFVKNLYTRVIFTTFALRNQTLSGNLMRLLSSHTRSLTLISHRGGDFAPVNQ